MASLKKLECMAKDKKISDPDIEKFFLDLAVDSKGLSMAIKILEKHRPALFERLAVVYPTLSVFGGLKDCKNCKHCTCGKKKP